MKRIARLLCVSLIASLIPLTHQGPARAAEADACPVPPDLALLDLSLPVSAKAAAIRKAVTIVALGGASTAGAAAGGGAYAYPARLEELLRTQLPGIQVDVVNRAAPARPVRDRLTQIEADLSDIKPDLVIWAPGSTAAGIAEDPDMFQTSLSQAATRIRATGADLIMIDLQYTPRIAQVINLVPYNAAIARIARQQDIAMLQRSALMRRWQEANVLQLDGTPKRGRVTAIRHLFNCVALALADGIAPAIRRAP